tara:strand:+ start:93 stop:284 length:192 start_codon:yes stop_codon:yes gene_type:complete
MKPIDNDLVNDARRVLYDLDNAVSKKGHIINMIEGMLRNYDKQPIPKIPREWLVTILDNVKEI